MHLIPRAASSLIVLLVVAGSRPAAAQSDAAQWMANCQRHSVARGRACEIREYTLTGVRKLDVDPGVNGGVSITAEDRRDIAIEARVQTDGDSDAEARIRAREITVTTAAGRLRATAPSRYGSWSVYFVLRVPRNLDIVARAVNGPVGITGVKGDMDINVENGPLSLREVAGSVRASVTNGPLSVSLGGSRWDGSGLTASAMNGPMTLTIPEDYSAELEAGTVNGPFTVQLPSLGSVRVRGKQLNTRLGNGGARVKVTTVNGPATIRQRAAETFRI